MRTNQRQRQQRPAEPLSAAQIRQQRQHLAQVEGFLRDLLAQRARLLQRLHKCDQQLRSLARDDEGGDCEARAAVAEQRASQLAAELHAVQQQLDAASELVNLVGSPTTAVSP